MDIPTAILAPYLPFAIPVQIGSICIGAKSLRLNYCRGLLWLSRRADLRGTHRLRHAEEDHDALTATAGRERFIRCPEATINVLPVVDDPNVTRQSDREIGLHLQAAADITAGRRDLVASLEAGRAVLGADTAKLDDWALRTSEIGDPHIVVAVDRRSKRGGQAKTAKLRRGVQIFRATRSSADNRQITTILQQVLSSERPINHQCGARC
jgi:hypothetical protein